MVSIRPYEDKDFEAMFAAFNARVAWLTSKGLEGQWGALPWGEDRKTRLRSGIPGDTKGVWVAVVDGESAGWLVITPYRSDYIPVTADDKPGKECFIKVLLVHPKFAGRGIGDRLLELAKESAIKDKAEWLRLDCWRGPEGKEGLVKYYEAKGFTKARAFATPKGDGSEWTGQLLEMMIGQSA
ncbi:acyl-CoA N-acyltransferase [Mycena amicta]|nr:acyl-CoA N-acyltransferase [Mycena amicta]